MYPSSWIERVTSRPERAFPHLDELVRRYHQSFPHRSHIEYRRARRARLLSKLLSDDLVAYYEELERRIWTATDWPTKQRAIEARFAIVRIPRRSERFDDADLEDLARSTIPQALARRAGLWTERDPAVVAEILGWNAGTPALVFPYRRPGRRTTEFRLRIRRRSRSRSSRRPYRQGAGRRPGIYYPPGVLERGDLRNRDKALIVVEGEKKCLCLDRLRYATIGLPGVWCARDSSQPKGRHLLHPWIREDVVVSGRVVIVCFDPDLAANPHVRKAAIRTMRMFEEAGAAEVRLVTWRDDLPPFVGGVDDLAFVRGDDAVHDLLDGASRSDLPTTDILIPLSVLGDPNLTATRKVVFGAFVGRARNSRARLPVSDVAHATNRSRRATREIVDELIRLQLLTRQRSRAKQDSTGSWRRVASVYEVEEYPEPQIAVRYADLQFGDAAALALAMLRRASGRVRVSTLAEQIGVSTATIRRVLQKLEHLVSRPRRGYVLLRE